MGMRVELSPSPPPPRASTKEEEKKEKKKGPRNIDYSMGKVPKSNILTGR